MINLDTCVKAADVNRALGPWCDSRGQAESYVPEYITPDELILEIGVHFGKWQYRYTERIPGDSRATFRENPFAYSVDRSILAKDERIFLKKKGNHESA